MVAAVKVEDNVADDEDMSDSDVDAVSKTARALLDVTVTERDCTTVLKRVARSSKEDREDVKCDFDSILEKTSQS